MVLNEHLDLSVTAEQVVKAAGRAFGVLIAYIVGCALGHYFKVFCSL